MTATPTIPTAAPIPRHPLAYEGHLWTCPVTGFTVCKDLKGNLAQRSAIISSCENNPHMQDQVMDLCRRSPLLWFNLFCWTFVVRKYGPDGRSLRRKEFARHVPMITWPCQDAALEMTIECIEEGEDALWDKSRDMGASWLLLQLELWYWLFVDDSQMGLFSRIEDDVDKAGRRKSLFWKIDYTMGQLPPWMVPRVPVKGGGTVCKPSEYQRGGAYRSHLKLENPANGSTIFGEATTEHMGRGDRLTFAVFDEFAAQDCAEAGWEAAADATDCRIANSTHIAGSYYTRLYQAGLEDGSPRVVVLDYADHPDKGIGRAWRIDTDGASTGITGRGFWWSPWLQNQIDRRKKSIAALAMNILRDPTLSGNLVFNAIIVTQHKHRYAEEPTRYELDTERKRFVESESGRWYLWLPIDAKTGRLRHVDEQTNFVQFADPSQGVGAANAANAVMDCYNGRVVAQFVDPNTPPDELAEQMAIAGVHIFGGQSGMAYTGWEINGPGGSLYKYLIKHGYSASFLYFQRMLGTKGEKKSKRYGWHSTRSSKKALLEQSDVALKRGEIIVPCAATCEEMLDYLYYDDGSIGPGLLADETTFARESHGDRVIGVSGCHMIRPEAARYRPKRAKFRKGTLGDISGHNESINPPPKKWFET